MEESFLQVVFTTIIEEESDSLNVGALLKIINTETGSEKSVGYANIYIFNEYRVESWNELLDNADSISGDVLEVIDVLGKAKDNEGIDGLIAVLDHIEIDKEHRGNGYFGELFKQIIEYLQYIDVNYIGLIPAKIYDDRVIQNDERAIDYYIEKGFKPISRRVGGNVVMGKSLL